MLVRDLCAALGVRLEGGDPAVRIVRVATLEAAGPDDLAALFEPRYRAIAALTRAAVVLTTPALSAHLPDSMPRMLSDDARTTWGAALRLLHPGPTLRPPAGVHATAIIDPSAAVDASASLGPFVVVGAGARIDANATLHGHAYVGAKASIGAGATLLPRATVLDGCAIAPGAQIGVGAVVGASGFGLDAHGLLPHIGIASVGAGASVGALSCVDRATVGETRIGDGAHLDNLVQVGHNARVGDGAVLCGQVGLAGGAVVESGAMLGGQAGVAGHVTVGAGAKIAAQSGVTHTLAGDQTYSGHPAEPNRRRLRRMAKLRRLSEASTGHVHATAQVHATAKVELGAIVGAHAVIGAECHLHPYAVIGAYTTLGPRCEVHPFAVVGGPAQDRRTDPNAPNELVCGAENVYREGVTISRGTKHGGGTTRIGDGGLFMANSHVGHDCTLGDRVTLANGVSLAGHVQIGDGAGLGGHAAVHQFARIGTLAFIAAGAMVSLDVPPYCLAAGDRARLVGLNQTGLRRAGMEAERIGLLKRAYRAMFMGTGRKAAAEDGLRSELAEVRALATFVLESERGTTRGR